MNLGLEIGRLVVVRSEGCLLMATCNDTVPVCKLRLSWSLPCAPLQSAGSLRYSIFLPVYISRTKMQSDGSGLARRKCQIWIYEEAIGSALWFPLITCFAAGCQWIQVAWGYVVSWSFHHGPLSVLIMGKPITEGTPKVRCHACFYEVTEQWLASDRRTVSYLLSIYSLRTCLPSQIKEWGWAVRFRIKKQMQRC